jgi:histidinol-phosphate aminotransferase
VKAAAETLHLYPDASCFSLREALAAKYGLPMNQIVVGNGSDEIIHLLGQIFLEDEGDEIIVGDPSFVRYDAAAGLANCRLTNVPLTADMRLDIPAMAARASERTKLIFIANPNNPTGTIVSQVEIEGLLQSVPSSTVVVLDEAYFEFAQGAPGMPVQPAQGMAAQPPVDQAAMLEAQGVAPPAAQMPPQQQAVANQAAAPISEEEIATT